MPSWVGARVADAVNGVRVRGCRGKNQMTTFSSCFCVLCSCARVHNLIVCLWLICGGGGGGGGAIGLGGEDADVVGGYVVGGEGVVSLEWQCRVHVDIGVCVNMM